MSARIKRREGNILKIALNDNEHVYAHVSSDPLVIFYDKLCTSELSPSEITKLPIAFRIFVMKTAVTNGVWSLYGFHQLSTDQRAIPIMYKQDRVSGRLFHHHHSFSDTNFERSALLSECNNMECAAVWSANHVEDRLRDHFCGRPNKWLRLMAIDVSKLPAD